MAIITRDEKNYIASRYYDYADCKPEYRQPEKAEALKQLMDYFKIDELDQYSDSNITAEPNDISVKLLPLDNMSVDKNQLKNRRRKKLKQKFTDCEECKRI